MLACQITFSANAGLSVDCRGARIWVDAVHHAPAEGFSSVSRELWAVMLEHPQFRCPDLIFYTHRHPDHYSDLRTREALTRFPRARLLTPWNCNSHEMFLSGEGDSLPPLAFHAVPLPHGGTEYGQLPHYGCVLDASPQRIFFGGDCTAPSEALTRCIQERPIDLAVMNFSWITLSQNRDYLKNILRPKHLLINHLPFPADDIFHYRSAAQQALRHFPELDVRLLLTPLQTERFTLD